MRRTDRGAKLSLQSSLRVRVTLAAGLAFIGLGAVVCLVLPRAYTEQAREALRERTRVLAHGVAHFVRHEAQRNRLSADVAPTPEEQLGHVAGWLDGEPDFDSLLFLDDAGELVARWPTSGETWAPEEDGAPDARHFVAVAPVSGAGPVASVAVRTSTARLVADLENVRWLFAAIFALACVAFWVVSRYLVSVLVDPLEEVRNAAMSLADGEREVTVPTTGNREIDELGEYLDTLGRKRRQSTMMANPLLEYLKRESPLPKPKPPETHPEQG